MFPAPSRPPLAHVVQTGEESGFAARPAGCDSALDHVPNSGNYFGTGRLARVPSTFVSAGECWALLSVQGAWDPEEQHRQLVLFTEAFTLGSCSLPSRPRAGASPWQPLEVMMGFWAEPLGAVAGAGP